MTVKTENIKIPFLDITPVPDEKWLYVRWVGQVGLKEVQQGAMAVLTELESYGYNRILNDNRELLGHWDDAIDWISDEWVPKALNLKLQKFAHLLSHYSYGQQSAKNLQLKVKDRIQMQLFTDKALAEQWLKTSGTNSKQ